MKPSKGWAFSQLEKYIWRSFINEILFRWKSAPNRILCCGLFSLISVSSVLGARTNCTHYNHKEREPERAAAMLEGGTGNQTGEMIGKNVIHRGEKIKGTYCIYRGKVCCRNADWRVKYFILKQIIEKLWCVQPALKSSMIQCCGKEKSTPENFFFNDCNLEDSCICPSTFLSTGMLWA